MKPTNLQRRRHREGSVFVEYLLLLTIVGIGTITGLAMLRGALTDELVELAKAIGSITLDPSTRGR